MAGDWIKFEHTTSDKPEVVRMATLLRIDQDAVVGKLLRVWVWADLNSVDGKTVGITEAFVDRITCRRGFAAAMRAVGWLHGDDGSLSFANFSRHNGATAKSRAIDNRKKSARRERDKCPENVPDTGGQNEGQNGEQKGGPEKRREEKSMIDPAPAGADAVGKADGQTQKPPPQPRERNPLFDALAVIDGCADLAQLTRSAGARIGSALAEIQKACPGLTVGELQRRAANYPSVMPEGSTLTAKALAANWARCDQAAAKTVDKPRRAENLPEWMTQTV